MSLPQFCYETGWLFAFLLVLFVANFVKAFHSNWVSGRASHQSLRRFRAVQLVTVVPRLPLVILCLLSQFLPCFGQHSVDPPVVDKSFANSFECIETPHHFEVALLPPWMLGTRVGEALKPGPTRFALVNPTSIVSKISQFDTLANTFQADIVCASETAATSKVQRLFSKQVSSVCHYKALWSAPVANQFDRLDGEVSMRGRAAGVGVFSRLPCRHALQTFTEAMFTTARLVHTIHTYGNLQFQVVTLYGLANHSLQSDQQTDQLMRAALEATEHMRLPTIIAGDFNCDPFTLDCSQIIRARHLTDLPSKFAQMYGFPMPPTCRDTTLPDNALLCPQMLAWLTDISVVDDPLFDTHKVVLFTLEIPTQANHTSRLVLPQSWIEYPIDSVHIAEQYAANSTLPTDLATWANKVERAVDLAYQQTQADHGVVTSQIKALPRRARGRCLPRKPSCLPLRALLPKSRPGDYVPKFEIHRFCTLKMVKQLRRIQSLRRRLVKLEYGGSTCGLVTEWQAILWADSPPGGFISWCCSTPELGPPPPTCPDLGYVNLAEQFLRHQVDSEIAFDHKCWLKKIQYSRYLDAKDQGHAKASAHLRNKDTPPLTELKEVVKEECSLVVEDPHTIWAYCDNPSQFVCQAPVQIDGCACRVKQIDDYGLLVTPLDPTHDWPLEGTAIQEQVVTRPQDIVDCLNAFWMPYWANPDVAQTMSSDFETFLNTLPDLPNPVVRLHDQQLWMNAVASLKPHSARGVDGISAAELQSLPPSAIAELANVLGDYKHGFPAWLMVARTFAVPKCNTTPRSSEIRPITVLAQVYRLWARVICSQLLGHYSSLLPPEIWGLLRGRGPFTASYQLQWWLEKLAFQKTPNAGLVLDLVKCFNSIHRPTVFAILLRLGVPADIITQWSCSLAVLTRTWSLQGFDGQLTECSHGFPEGDVFSVLAMIGVALSWTANLKHTCPASLIGAYADNWCLASVRKADFPILISQTLRYVQLLHMSIDWKKTWMWATDKGLLLALKHALGQQLPHLQIERLTAAMDLGSQMTYSGPPRLGKFKARLSLFKQRCHLLQAMPHDVYTKAHLASTSILPTLYGVALLPLGEAHIASMRTQLVNAVLGANHSRNSTLAMQFLPRLVDPGVWIILQAIEACRRYLIQATPSDRALFCSVLSKHNGVSTSCRGPASCLKHYLLRLGWTVDSAGNVHVSPFVSLSLHTSSKQSWVFWANWTWQQEILSHCDRKALAGCTPINLFDTRSVLHKLSAGKFARVLQEISGAFQVASQKQKWDPTASPECNFCPAIDTRHHRVFECPATAHIRDKHQDIIAYYQYQNDLIHELPVIVVDPQTELLQTIHWSQPVASFDNRLVESLRQVIEQGLTPSFYTDGSCYWPTLPSSRYAAFSVVLDTLLQEEDRLDAARGYKLSGIYPSSLKPILISRTQGPQTIARSELFAVLLVVENFPVAKIYCDSQTTIDRFHTCQVNRDPMTWIDSADFDLLLRLQDVVHSRHTIVKVTAHVDPTYTSDLELCYHQLGNAVADRSANMGCQSIHPWLVRSCKTACHDLQKQRTSLLQWYDFLLEMQQHCAVLMSTMEKQSKVVTTRSQQRSTVEMFQTWSVTDPWVKPELRLSSVVDTAWGRLISLEMVQWMEQLQWPQDFQSDNYGVTWMELVLSFCLHLGCYFPVPRDGANQQQHLVTLPCWDSLQQYQVKFSDLANYFSIFYGQIDKLTFPARWPPVRRGLVRSLYSLGSVTHSAGFVCRPKFPFQKEVTEYLKIHFLHDKEQAHVQVPQLCLQPRLGNDEISGSIRGSWHQRSLTAQVAMRRFRQQIKADVAAGCRQRQLLFR